MLNTWDRSALGRDGRRRSRGGARLVRARVRAGAAHPARAERDEASSAPIGAEADRLSGVRVSAAQAGSWSEAGAAQPGAGLLEVGGRGDRARDCVRDGLRAVMARVDPEK